MNRPYLRRPALLLPVVLLMTACSSGLVHQSANSATGSGGSSGPGKSYYIVMVAHAPCTDTFWVNVCDGLNAAGKDLGIRVKYLGTPENLTDPNIERQNILNAIAQHPSAMVVTDPEPNALNSTIGQIKAAGIPFIIINSGPPTTSLGQLTYIGNNEVASGAEAGTLLNSLGVKHLLTFITPPGQVPLVDQRYKGLKSTFTGKLTAIQIPLTAISNPTTLSNDYKTALVKDPSIDGVFSMGSAVTDAMVAAENAVDAQGRKLIGGAIDVTGDTLTAIKSGKLAFTLNQQPFAQGYLPVVYLYQYLKYGVTPAMSDIFTGPAVVNSQNVSSQSSA